jgi:hypothetical protein
MISVDKYNAIKSLPANRLNLIEQMMRRGEPAPKTKGK